MSRNSATIKMSMFERSHVFRIRNGTVSGALFLSTGRPVVRQARKSPIRFFCPPEAAVPEDSLRSSTPAVRPRFVVSRVRRTDFIARGDVNVSHRGQCRE